MSLIFLFSILTSSCSSLTDGSGSSSYRSGIQKVYSAPTDLIWKAIMKSVKHPIAVNDVDAGVIETDFIRSNDGFKPPAMKGKYPSAQRYKILITFVKGKNEGKNATLVTVKKSVENQTDFFSEPNQVNSDGLEEETIHYRIQRQLEIEELLKRNLKES